MVFLNVAFVTAIQLQQLFDGSWYKQHCLKPKTVGGDTIAYTVFFSSMMHICFAAESSRFLLILTVGPPVTITIFMTRYLSEMVTVLQLSLLLSYKSRIVSLCIKRYLNRT